MVQTVKKESRKPGEEEKVERFPVLEGVRKYAKNHVLLVGRPGSGKSTALARLLLDEATQQTSIPVLVELRYWQGSIVDLICEAFARHELPLTAQELEPVLSRLAQGATPKEMLFLFDGVNELPSEEARSQLSAFRRNHPKLPMIFTTRDLSLGGDLGIEKKLEMQPLTEVQMQAFIRSCVPEQAEQMLRQLNDRLREFGQTPLLLWMLCEVIQQTPDNRLPSNLAEVFQAFTAMYEISSVRKHEVALLKGDVRPLSDRRLWKKALKALAFLMMQGETPVDFRVVIDRNEAESELSRVFPKEQFPGRDILDDLLKYHLLQNRSVDQIEFRHQLIQEYYAAEALLEQLPQLDDEQLKQKYLNYLKWTEPVATVLALVESEDQALKLTQLAIEVDKMLGARMAGEVKWEYQVKTLNLVTTLKVSKVLKIKLLDEMHSEAAIPELCLALEDKEDLRITLKALGRIGSDQAICKIPQAINSNPSSVQFLAIRILEQIGSRVAIAGLRQIALNTDSSDIKHRINQALKKLEGRSTVKSLAQNATVHKLRVGNSATVEKVLPIPIQQDIYPSIHRLIQNLLEPEEACVWEEFAKMLEKLEDKTAIPVLLATLDDDTHITYILALGLLGCERVIPRLLNALKDEEELVRGLAVLALSKIGTPPAIAGVIQALEDKEPEVCEVAAESLIQLSHETAVPGLLQILENEWLDSDLRIRAAKALMTIGVEDAIEGLFQALQDTNFEISWAVADIFKAAGKDEIAFRELFEKIQDEDYHTRYRSAISLGYLGETSAIPMLITAIDHEDQDICWKAIYVLGRFSEHPIPASTLQALYELATPRLIQLILKSKFNDAKAEAIEALGKLGNPQLLSEFWHYSSSSLEFLKVIKVIQKRWNFYNYEVFQAYLEAQKPDRQTSQNSDRSPITQNFYAPVSAVAGNVEGNLITPPPDSVE
ncbi:HEAT repeat domain-containing protein [Phormidesmis priestleyi]|nr:HEAT repeat domain-containing protein [Phormidesmis priestleyi]